MKWAPEELFMTQEGQEDLRGGFDLVCDPKGQSDI